MILLFAPASFVVPPWNHRYNELSAPKLTAVDNTVLSRKLFFGNSVTMLNRLKTWSTDIYACGNWDSRRGKIMAQEVCIPARTFLGARLKPFDIEEFDASYAPRFEQWEVLLEKYYQAFRANELKPDYDGRPLEKPQDLVALEQDMAASIMSYASKDAGLYKVAIWLAHFMVLFIGALMIIFRGDVGSVILWPFGLVFTGLRKGGKVAKDLHEKV